jgi:D-aminopeptidase
MNRPRARDIGIDIGIFKPGPLNTITDVDGVLVGNVTLMEGEGPLVAGKGPVRTGISVILPHGGNLFREKVPAGAFVMNAFGKSTGLQQINELGSLETPIALTNTLNIPRVADALAEWSILQSPEIGITTGTVNPIVGDINDGFLNDIQGRHVGKEHVFKALESARAGNVEEGSRGAGTGCMCMGFKGGIGTASRVLPVSRGGYTLGVFAQTNFGGMLSVNGAPVGREMGIFDFIEDVAPPSRQVETPEGSCMIVIATDAPLDQRQLVRVAKRAGLGMARTGFYGGNGSGDFFIAFSTSPRYPHKPGSVASYPVVSNDAMSAIFAAAVEVTEEAVINSVITAETVIGRDGHTGHSIEIDRLTRILEKYNALNWNENLLPFKNR